LLNLQQNNLHAPAAAAACLAQLLPVVLLLHPYVQYTRGKQTPQLL
jgi:hypothetical protein